MTTRKPPGSTTAQFGTLEPWGNTTTQFGKVDGGRFFRTYFKDSTMIVDITVVDNVPTYVSFLNRGIRFWEPDPVELTGGTVEFVKEATT